MTADLAGLLKAWHGGDELALNELYRRSKAWLHRYVTRRMTPELRRYEGSEDVVSEVLLRVIREAPKFWPQNDKQYLKLIGKIAHNRIVDRLRWAHSSRRPAGRDVPLPTAVSRIGVMARSADEPGQVIEREEERSFVALALQLAKREDREVLHLRQYDGLRFSEIGKALGIQADAARMRYRSALVRLQRQVVKLQEGQLDDLLGDGVDGDDGEFQE